MEPQRQSHIIKQKTGPDDPELQATLQEALAQVSPEEVVAIADELAERQARLFHRVWNLRGEAWKTDTNTLASSSGEVASAVTHTRANAQSLSGYFSQDHFRLFDELVAGNNPAPVRVATFVETLNALDTRLGLELATGLL